VGFSSRADTSYQDWQFTNNANPALPTVFTNTAGVATATIVLGYSSIGWQPSLSGFGTQTGLWDLGFQNSDDPAHDTRGQVRLDIPNPVPASGNSHTALELRVVQFVDGFFYTGDLTFSIPGAVFSGRTVVESLTGLPGKWVEDQYQWRLAPSPAPVSLTITGAVGGTLLDRIRADTAAPVGQPAVTIVSGITATDKVYDGTDIATISSNAVVLAGVLPADAGQIALSTNGYVATFASAGAGLSNEVSVIGLSLTGARAGDYVLVQPTGLTAAIGRAPLTIVSGIRADDKVYDGTKTATISATFAVLIGVLPADAGQVALSTNGYLATFASAGAGSSIGVSVSGLTLTGPKAEDYAPMPPALTANITPADPIVTLWPTASTITYGQTLAASTLSGGSATPPGSFAFTTPSTAPNIGTAPQSVTFTPTDTANYRTAIGSVSVTVNSKALTVTGIVADSKVYDNTTNATLIVSNALLAGVVSGDTVTLSTTNAVGAFADKKVGTNKLVTVSGLTLLGADTGKYTLTQPTTNADITPASLAVTGITAGDKIYDSTTNATITVSNALLVGVLNGDTVMLNTTNASGAFADKNAGTGKLVTVRGLTLLGTDAGEYTLTQPTTNADIRLASLTVTGVTASDKVYDGTTNAMLNTSNAALNGVISGDAVALNAAGAAGAFTDPNVGANKPVLVSGLTLSGADAGNYDLTPPALAAGITPADPTVTAWPTASAITYGQTLAASTLSGGSATPPGTFAFTAPSSVPRAGTTPQSVTYTPTDTANYKTANNSVSLTVNPKTLTVTGITASDKVYDGTTTTTLHTNNATLNGVISGDAVALNTAGATGVFTDPNVGTNRPVLVSGLTLSGADAGNYSLTQPSLTANITPANSATALVSSQNPSSQGSNVTFTATVTPLAPAATTPTGNVQFYTNGVAWGSPTALTSGAASLSTADLPAGTNSVSCSYLGDSNFLGSSNSLAQVVRVVPNTPVTIVIQDNGNGTVTLAFTGTPGARYVVQASDDLAVPAWVNVSTNTAGTNGHWAVTETMTGHPIRFYRSAKP
jgi:hypothetical protein